MGYIKKVAQRVAWLDKPNKSISRLKPWVYQAKLPVAEHQISDGLVFYTYAIASNTQTFTNRPTDEKKAV